MAKKKVAPLRLCGTPRGFAGTGLPLVNALLCAGSLKILTSVETHHGNIKNVISHLMSRDVRGIWEDLDFVVGF